MEEAGAGEARRLWETGRRGQVADVGSAGRTWVYVGADVVLKVFEKVGSKPAREVAGLSAARRAGAPVPVVQWSGDIDGHPAVLLTKLPGTQPEPTSDVEHLACAAALGRAAASIRCEVPAYGAWTAAPVASATDLVLGRLPEIVATTRPEPIVPLGLIDRCAEEVAAAASDLGAGQAVLVHRDLSTRNIFGVWTDGAFDVTAVFDFEAAGGGQPEEELRWAALAELGGLQPAGALTAMAEAGAYDDLSSHRLRCYTLELALDIIGYAGRRNPPLGRAAAAAAERLLHGECLPGWR